MYKKLFNILFILMLMFAFSSRINAWETYSDNFQKLTSGTITIHTNGQLSTELVEDYVSKFSSSEFSFSVIGELSGDNKIEITLYSRSAISETHDISVIKGDLDNTVFTEFGMLNNYNIPADLSVKSDDYTRSFIGEPLKRLPNGRKKVITFTIINDSSGTAIPYLVYEEYEEIGDDYISDMSKIQYRKITVDYIGYDYDNYSERYLNSIGKNIVINTDFIEKSDISGKIGGWVPFTYSILNCEVDYSFCDILIKGDIDNSSELHRVAITNNSTISSEFKKTFDLNKDNEIEMVFDTDFNFNYYNINDVSNKIEKTYFCNDTECTLVVQADDGSFFEKHVVDVKKVGTSPTNYYLSNIGLTKDLYYGQNDFDIYELEGSQYFGKNTKVSDCSEEDKTCKVSVVNSNGRLETHEVSFILKEGKSPFFTSKLPGNIEFSAVYKNDYDYLDEISHAYMIRNGLYYGYMVDINENDANVNLNYEKSPEFHKVNVSYKEKNPVAEQVIDNILDRMKNDSIKVVTEDLEYVNEFYYNYRGYFTNNYDSISLNNIIKKYIDNSHVGYFFSSYLPSESRYFSSSSGEIVLYYDGVAYGVSDSVNHLVNNIIYIPNNTQDTKEAYISAAQKRIDDYLGNNSGVEIAYSGPYYAKLIDEKSDDAKFSDYNIDKSKFDGNEYSIAYDGRVEYVLIYKDSSRMQTDTFFSSDINNNVFVKSSTANYPINTMLNTKIMDEENEKYGTILKKLGVTKALVVDINLYSPIEGEITEFDGEKFEVGVPVNDLDLLEEELMAYHIDKDGKVESYNISLEGKVAKFITSHFSEYIIAKKTVENNAIEKNTEVNPQTGDNILSSVLLGIISSIIIFGTSVYLNRKVLINKI